MNFASLSQGTATTSSYLALDSNNNVVLTSSAPGSGGGGGSANAQGPVNSLQFNTGSGGISGSANLSFVTASNTLFVTGTLIVSGAIEANTFDIISTTITEINQSGSTAFGDTNDDTHHFTGSLSVFSSSTDLFAVDVENKSTKIKTGLTFNRTAITANYSVLKSDYYVGVNTATPSAVITASLPNANTLNNGQTFVFKDEGGAANTYNVVISASAGQTIDNQNKVILESPYSALTIYTDGSSKFFIT
jgi:nucleoporin NUP42